MSSGRGALWPWLLAAGGAAVAAFAIFRNNPVTQAITSVLRTPQSILDAVAAIDPENNPLLQPGADPENAGLVRPTWCNRFVAMVTEALGAPVPSGGWPRAGIRANDMIDWLDAGNDGWYPVSKDDAQAAALAGHLALATYRNLNGPGHLALVLPYPGAMQIAQAGAHNSNQIALNSPLTFGNIQPIFYAHD